jgi:hypothetical protein
MPVDAQVAAPLAPKLPYRGIAPFRYADQRIFAEREKETWSLMSLVTLYRGALLYGESGTGKSSLIDAGLIPAALAEDFVVDKLRVALNSKDGEFVVERIAGTEAEPPTYLRSSLVEGDGGAALPSLFAEEFERRVRSFQSAGGKREIPLLVFDQFEELITQLEEAKRRARHEGEHVAEHAAQAQRRILDAIASLLHDDELPVKLLFVFREDYLAKLNNLFKLYPNLVDQYLFLQAPRAQKLESLIRAPFEKNPGKYSPNEFTPELARQLAAKMSERGAGEEINLTELQIVCLELWQSGDAADTFEKNKIEKLLSDYLTKALSATGDLQDTAVALLGRLVTGSNTRNIISEEDLIADVEVGEGITRKRAADALDILVGTKLVRRELRHDTRFCEITSEFLVDWIVEKRQQHDAEEKVKKEREAEREQARQDAARMKRQIFILLALFLAGAVAFVVYKLYDNARDARRDAEIRRLEADAERFKNNNIINMLTLLTSQSTDDKRNGLELLTKFAETNAIPRELAFALLSMVRDQSADLSQDASRLLGQAAGDDTELGKLIDAAAKSDRELAERLPPRIKIMFPTGSQRDEATRIKKQLEKRGYVVPLIGQVDYDSAPAKTQLRYFLDTDEEKAKEAAGAIRASGVGISGAVEASPGRGNAARPGQFELWLAAAPVETGAQWYVRVRFGETEKTKGQLTSAVTTALDAFPVGQLSFPQTNVAEIGPYEDKEKARQFTIALRSALQSVGLRASVAISPR